MRRIGRPVNRRSAQAVLGNGIRASSFGIRGARKRRLAKALPYRSLRAEEVCEVDELFRREDFVCFGERLVLGGVRKRPAELERRRRFYSLTPLGRKVFELEIARMKAVLRRVRLSRLQPAEQDER